MAKWAFTHFLRPVRYDEDDEDEKDHEKDHDDDDRED